MTRNLVSSWAQLRKLSSSVIYVDIRKAFYSVLDEEVVGPVMGRSDRAEVMARLGWTEHQLGQRFRGGSMADWHQTHWFTVQGAPFHRGSSW